jgi:hypothetical protein
VLSNGIAYLVEVGLPDPLTILSKIIFLETMLI